MPSFAWAVDNLTPGPPVGPDLSGASVSGRTLTLTFDGPLDEGSEPAADAFRVSTLARRRARPAAMRGEGAGSR